MESNEQQNRQEISRVQTEQVWDLLFLFIWGLESGYSAYWDHAWR